MQPLIDVFLTRAFLRAHSWTRAAAGGSARRPLVLLVAQVLLLWTPSLAHAVPALGERDLLRPDLSALQHAAPAFKAPAFARAGGATWQSLVVRFERALTEAEESSIESIETEGLVFLRFSSAHLPAPNAKASAADQRSVQRFREKAGQIVKSGRLYAMRATAAGLFALEAQPLLNDYDLATPPAAPLPARENPWGRVPQILGTDDVWESTLADGTPLRGQGVLIADLDTGIDVFHPSLFRPDAGLYSWIDVDGDDVFSPNLDAVDLNRNGVADPGEILLVLGGNVYELDGTLTSFADGFDPAQSWLYADANVMDGERNVGPDYGFTDETPAFGEPLFLADDLDQNGMLDVGEKLLRLGSSKVKAIYQVVTGDAWFRGTNLSQYPDYDDRAHGSSVSGLLVGGVPGRNFIVGVAPQADLIMLDSVIPPEVDLSTVDFDAGQLAAMIFAREQGAQVLLHEYGQRVGYYADGSSVHEEALDDLSAEGMVQVTATHNFANNGGDAFLNIAPGATEVVTFRVEDGGGFFPPAQALMVNFRWRNAGLDLVATLEPPAGAAEILAGDRFGARLYSFTTLGLSSRGTSMLNAIVYELDETGAAIVPLALGEWSLRLSNQGNQTLSGPFKVTDESSYSALITVVSHPSSDFSTMAWPSTADSAISVGASVGNRATAQAGEVLDGMRYFSGRGPRIDGELGIDVVAPSDHYASAPSGETPAGSFVRFGGTSGALPQVAGAVALLLQQDPALTPSEVRTRLHESAGDQNTGSLPNNDWGFGRLNVYRLVHGEDPPENTAPVVVAAVPGAVGRGRPLTIDVADTSDAEDALETLTFRVDVGYDGTWDAEATGQAPTIAIEEVGPLQIVIEARDPFGARGATVVTVEVAELPPIPIAMADGCGCRLGTRSGLKGEGAAGMSGPFSSLAALTFLFYRRRQRRLL